MQHDLALARLTGFVSIALLAAASPPESGPSGELQVAVEELAAALPSELIDLTETRMNQTVAAARLVNARAELLRLDSRAADEHLASIHQLCRAKQRVDVRVRQVLALRVTLATSPAGEERRRRARCFLGISSELLDLSGRLNYLLRATIIRAAFAFADRPVIQDRLVDQLFADRSTIGASMMAPLLLDPPAESPNDAKGVNDATKRKVLRFLAAHGRCEAAPIVVRFLRSREATPQLAVDAADALCRLGLAQPAQPGSVTSGSASTPMTARALHTLLRSLDAGQLDHPSRQRRAVLLEWLDARARRGVGWTGYTVNGFVIQPGDWVLMRNVSPYNLFTDLSPGLFTHAGVVALEQDPQGVGRLVLVDLNERDARIAATNIEDALPSALYFAVLRPDDPTVARTMSETAASIVGNPAQFDLNFETSRIEALRGQPLAGERIETYCAGLLLLCAQATGLPREEFFPLVEYPGSDRLARNLQRIGLRLGADFVSPTGALFGGRIKLVYLSEPMYDPARHVTQVIYDHFVRRMASEKLVPRPNLFQSLRQELAEVSARNPLLGDALATAAGVDRDTDLAAAARALAVVETLDAIAGANSGEFTEALAALEAGPPEQLARRGFSNAQIAGIEHLRQRHAELVTGPERTRRDQRQITRALIEYYTIRGKKQLDERFFDADALDVDAP